MASCSEHDERAGTERVVTPTLSTDATVSSCSPAQRLQQTAERLSQPVVKARIEFENDIG